MPKKLNSSSEGSAANATRREVQHAREAALIEEGRRDIRAGRCISGAALDAWLEYLDGDQELFVPDGRRNRPHRH
jgi:hypothetical protein